MRKAEAGLGCFILFVVSLSLIVFVMYLYDTYNFVPKQNCCCQQEEKL